MKTRVDRLEKTTDGMPPDGAVERRPELWSYDVLLRDGATMHFRGLRPDDREHVAALHERSSPKTHYRRFFSAMPHLSANLLAQLTTIDQVNRVAIVAESDEGICAVGRYDRALGSASAEVAFVVEDAYQGRGIGTLLLEYLAVIARGQGIDRFEALTLAENAEMLGVFRHSGFSMSTSLYDAATRRVVLDLKPTAQAAEARQERDSVATVASIRRLMEPSSVAIIGATDRLGTPGYQLVKNLLESEFSGKVALVNPSRKSVCGRESVASIGDVAFPVDVAVIVVPGEHVEAIVAECAEAKVRALVIISAGFAETHPDGLSIQDRIVHLARRHGMRIVGPNCLGIANMTTNMKMNATFSSFDIPAGSIGVMTQSGAVGIELIHELGARGLGVSTFASVGNKSDVSGNDFLTFWEHDDDTHQIALYLESFGNPRGFARIAPRVALKKPIVAIKAGRGTEAAAAASSHTAAVALPDEAVDALLFQSGVLRVESVEELADVCSALNTQLLPQGARVAIVTNAGGPAILATDVCDRVGLTLASLSASTQQAIADVIGRPIGSGPLDLRADSSPNSFERAVRGVLRDPFVDAVVAIVADVAGNGVENYAKALDAVTGADQKKPLLCAFVPNGGSRGMRTPVFGSAERAIRALGHLRARQVWLDEANEPKETDFDSEWCDDLSLQAMRSLVDRTLSATNGDGWMSPADAFLLIQLAGISAAVPAWANDADSAVELACRIGYPVALKSGSPRLLHKSDTGGVYLNLHNDYQVMCAYQAMERALGDRMEGAMVQPMCRPGVELLAGIVTHRDLGPVVVIGEGGRLTELRHDTSLRRPPISHAQATRQLHALRAMPLLAGFRGSEPVKEEMVIDAIMRLGKLAEVLPEIAELDINPLIANERGVCAADVKIRLTRPILPKTGVLRQVR